MTSPSGERLYALLPQVYRARDARGELARWLGALGAPLDLLRGGMLQRLRDAFPDTCQPWLVPYFAQLLDVRLLSPAEDGRRDEIRRAIRWRKRKGTLRAAAEIVHMLGRFHLERTLGDEFTSARPFVLREGAGRVATTCRVGTAPPRRGLASLEAPHAAGGDGRLRWDAVTREEARTLDLRVYAALVSVPGRPGRFLQRSPAGVPAWPDTYHDPSRRTVDTRDPGPRSGRCNPGRLIVHVRPPDGFFPPGWRERLGPGRPASQDPLRSRPLVGARLSAAGSRPVAVRGPVHLRRCLVEGSLHITGGAEPSVLEDCIVLGRVAVYGGGLVVRRCAVRTISSSPDAKAGREPPALRIEDSLVGALAADGHVELVASTILRGLSARTCFATDSILAGTARVRAGAGFRYCRVPQSVAGAPVRLYRCLEDRPVFHSTILGLPGCGVLRMLCPRLLAGAEDGGELGSEHHRQRAARERAVRDKLAEHLPLGVVPAIVRDERLGPRTTTDQIE